MNRMQRYTLRSTSAGHMWTIWDMMCCTYLMKTDSLTSPHCTSAQTQGGGGGGAVMTPDTSDSEVLVPELWVTAPWHRDERACSGLDPLSQWDWHGHDLYLRSWVFPTKHGKRKCSVVSLLLIFVPRFCKCRAYYVTCLHAQTAITKKEYINITITWVLSIFWTFWRGCSEPFGKRFFREPKNQKWCLK
jgi:hypothetical protein